MKTYKIIILMFFFLFGLSFSCSRDNGNRYNDYCETIGYNVNYLTDFTNHPGKYYLDSSSIVEYQNLEIRLVADLKVVKSEIAQNFYSFSNLLADDVNLYLLDTIANITVITNQKYNNSYKAKDTINDILIDTRNNTLNNSNNSNYTSEAISFFLTNPPDTTRECSFTFIVKHTDGDVFKTQTIPITITP